MQLNDPAYRRTRPAIGDWRDPGAPEGRDRRDRICPGQKPRAVQNRSPVCPSFVDAEATAIGEPHSQVLDLTNSRPSRGGRLALEADLLPLDERRAVDGGPEAQADVSRRLDAVQQLRATLRSLRSRTDPLP